MATEHSRNLLELIKPHNLELIDEKPFNLRTMFVEPKYFKNGEHEEYKCPDLFLGYRNGLWSVIEMKHSWNSREKAFLQIESGFKMMVDVFGVPYDNLSGKLVVYKHGFEYENYR